ncbi:MAG: signal peptidase II [Nannocystaceae bacterium]
MPSQATRPVLTRMAWFALATFAGGGCDLQTKAWAENSLAELPGRAMMVVEPWLEFSLTYNRGTAFSLIPDLGASRLIFGVLALAVLGLLAVLVHRWRSDRGEALALGAIAGGALGNGVDRALREAPGGGTGVVDFIKLNYPWGGSWPIFNIADVLVAVGIAYFVLRGLREASKGAATPATAAS